MPLLNNAVANIICQIVFGRRFDYADHIFQSMLHHLTEMAYLEGSIWALVGYTFRQLSGTSSIIPVFSKQLYDSFPSLMKHLPGPHNRIFSSSTSLQAFIWREIQRHKLDLDPSNPRDYIDSFLIEERVWCW